jgi:hypothetical protein
MRKNRKNGEEDGEGEMRKRRNKKGE